MSDVKFSWRGDELTAELLRALGAANYDNAVDLSHEAAKQAPLEYGDLEGSLEPGGDGTLFADESNGLNMTVGSNLPYAAKQHEELDYHHKAGRKAKYLEDPLNANYNRYMQHLADAGRGVIEK